MDPNSVSTYEVEAWHQSASSTQLLSWHKDEKLRDAVLSFHKRFARVPRRLDEAREGHTDLIEKLLSYLRGKGISVHPEYVGSAYEGVKVSKSEGNDDLEFDVLVTMKLPSGWKVYAKDVPNIAGHVLLYLSDYNGPILGQKKTFFDNILTRESGYYMEGSGFFIDGKKTIDKFFGELQSWIDSSWETKQRIVLRRHGPAVQMDVYEQMINSDPPYYTVDVVPTLDIEVSGNGKLPYVAKPVKSRLIPDPGAWRRLRSEETKFTGRYSDPRVDRFTPTHLRYMTEIGDHLRYRLHFAGHKVGASDDNLEFKVLVIDDSKAHQTEVAQIGDKPDFFRLNSWIGQTRKRLDSREETTTLVNALQEILDTSQTLNGKVHIRRNGPIVRLIVCECQEQTYVHESVTKPPLYYVDMILTYDISGMLYAARPREDRYAMQLENSKAWRLSFSTEAKEAMYGHSYGCLKMVFRILKVLRNREVALSPLSSYHLKTVLLWLIREQDSSAWNEKYIGERLMDALLKLEGCLKRKNLRHYYLPGVNLTSHMVEDCINSMGCRIHVLCTKEREMMQVLQAFN